MKLRLLYSENNTLVCFQIKRNMIAVTIFLLIMNQMEFHLVHDEKEFVRYRIVFLLIWSKPNSIWFMIHNQDEIFNTIIYLSTWKDTEVSFSQCVFLMGGQSRQLFERVALLMSIFLIFLEIKSLSNIKPPHHWKKKQLPRTIYLSSIQWRWTVSQMLLSHFVAVYLLVCTLTTGDANVSTRS